MALSKIECITALERRLRSSCSVLSSCQSIERFTDIAKRLSIRLRGLHWEHRREMSLEHTTEMHTFCSAFVSRYNGVLKCSRGALMGNRLRSPSPPSIHPPKHVPLILSNFRATTLLFFRMERERATDHYGE